MEQRVNNERHYDNDGVIFLNMGYGTHPVPSQMAHFYTSLTSLEEPHVTFKGKLS